MKLKAYKVDCVDYDHGATILFAESSRKVSRYSHRDDCDCEFIDRHVRRAPEFDQYAPGPVTIAQYLAEGWYWHCQGCEQQIWNDDPFVLIDGDRIFCSRRCVHDSYDRHLKWVGRHTGKLHESMEQYAAALRAYVEANPREPAAP